MATKPVNPDLHDTDEGEFAPFLVYPGDLGSEGTGRKTKFSHPYSYDPFPVWVRSDVEPTDAIHSDRLLQWDFAKHDELCQKHFGNKGQFWSGRSPKLIEAFLRDFTGDPGLTLCEVIEGCNLCNGYPYWTFRFRPGLLKQEQVGGLTPSGK